jgi:hypothetical protein
MARRNRKLKKQRQGNFYVALFFYKHFIANEKENTVSFGFLFFRRKIGPKNGVKKDKVVKAKEQGNFYVALFL